MAKKAYSLNYNIERDTDRLKAVEEILDSLENTPSNSDLEQMASYILYGKDENGKNAVQRKETTDSNRRYKSFARTEDKNESLDALLENPLSDQSNMHDPSERYIYLKKRPAIKREKYAPDGTLLDAGDSNIPGMRELWDSIDRLEHQIAVAEGKVAANEGDRLILNSYRLYQLKHQLIDLRRHQYYLKDAYCPTIHFLNVRTPSPQPVNFDSDSAYWVTEEEWRQKVASSPYPWLSHNLADYERDEQGNVKWVVRRQAFDWENPRHIKFLIDHYSALYMQVWDKPDSWGRTLIYDFDRYTDMAELDEVRQWMLLRRIDRATHFTIMYELSEKFGKNYNENHICTILTTEIPTKIAKAAKKHRLMLENDEEHKRTCRTCGRKLPLDRLFFNVASNTSSGFTTRCKECERRIRNERKQMVVNKK